MNRVQAKLLEEIIENDAELNDWERRFVDNIYTNYSDRPLNDNQNHKLNEIHKHAVFQ